MRSVIAWFWALLPDKCQVSGCSRKGIRGNEQILYGIVMCDNCYAKRVNDGKVSV